jgi:hypothetical protein
MAAPGRRAREARPPRSGVPLSPGADGTLTRRAQDPGVHVSRRTRRRSRHRRAVAAVLLAVMATAGAVALVPAPAPPAVVVPGR